MQKAVKLIASGAIASEASGAPFHSYKSGTHLGERFADGADPYVTLHALPKTTKKAEPVYKVVTPPKRHVARPARVYHRPVYREPIVTYVEPAPVRYVAPEPVKYVAPAPKKVVYEPSCDDACVTKKAQSVLDSLEAEVEADKEYCLRTAEKLRQEMVAEARALRVALATDAADRVEASIAALETLKSESLVLLEAIVDRIDEEKAATVARIKDLREDIEWQIKQLKKGGKLQVLNFAQVSEPKKHDTKGKIKELIAKFEKAVEAERKAFDKFVAARR